MRMPLINGLREQVAFKTPSFLMWFLICQYGCQYTPMPDLTYWPSGADKETVVAVKDAWTEHGAEAIGPQCIEEEPFLRFGFATEAEFQGLCLACGPSFCPGGRVAVQCPWGCAHECFVSQGFGGTRDMPLVVIHEDSRTRFPELWPHGLLHWLERCTHRGYSYTHSGLVWDTVWPEVAP